MKFLALWTVFVIVTGWLASVNLPTILLYASLMPVFFGQSWLREQLKSWREQDRQWRDFAQSVCKRLEALEERTGTTIPPP